METAPPASPGSGGTLRGVGTASAEGSWAACAGLAPGRGVEQVCAAPVGWCAAHVGGRGCQGLGAIYSSSSRQELLIVRVNGQYPPGGAFSAETPVAGTPAPTQAAGQGPLSSAWRLRQALWSLRAAGWEGHPRPVSPTLLLQPLFTLRRDPLMAREGRGRGPPGGPGWRRGADGSPTPGSQGCTGAWGRGGKGLGVMRDLRQALGSTLLPVWDHKWT